jgi:hypothetical protein
MAMHESQSTANNHSICICYPSCCQRTDTAGLRRVHASHCEALLLLISLCLTSILLLLFMLQSLLCMLLLLPKR